MSDVLPHDLEVERGVLGAAMLHPEALGQVIENTDPLDFYHEAHQAVRQALQRCFEEATATDHVTVGSVMAEQGTLERSGGIVYLTKLPAEIATWRNVAAHIKILVDLSSRRGLIRLSQNLQTAAFNPKRNPQDLTSEALEQLQDFTTTKRSQGPVHISDCLTEVLALAQDAYSRGQRFVGYDTGFTDLNELVPGFVEGEIYLLAARPSVGKTALALSLAVQVAELNQVGVAIFSLEMGRSALTIRLLSSRTGIDGRNIRLGRLSQAEWTQVTEELKTMAELPIHIDDASGLTPPELAARVRALHRHGKVGLVVIDYLQLMTARADSREQEIAKISRSLKALAKQESVAVLALSQLNREIEKRTTRRPQLSDLRESGSLEQDSDVTMFIYHPSDDAANPEFAGLAEIIVAKQRNGPQGSFLLSWDKRTTRFSNIDRKDAAA